jgi:light-regulated signal transduction histidine kinase (bacteriophytochrome)
MQLLKDSERRFRALVNATSDVIYRMNPDWTIMHLLDGTGFLTDSDKPIRNWRSQFIHPDDQALFQTAIDNAIFNRSNFQLEHRILQSNGTTGWTQSQAVPVFNEQDELIEWVGTASDITARKKAEEDLRLTKIIEENLEQIVKERTQELQRSNDDLLQFAHVASHDLKEPVRKVKIFTNQLEKEFGQAMPETAAMYLNKIYGATDRMNNMIEGVLNYSTLNNMEQVFSEVNLKDTLNNIETDLEVLIQQKGASIRYESFPCFEGAPLLIYQLFYNLINNSLKFSHKEIPPVILINSALQSKNEEGKLEITLSDNGIGFSQLYAESIFNTFTRLHSRDRYEGTGLGLALCKKIVERHNGIIRALGEEGKGSSFIVTIPLKQAQA